MGTPMVIAIVWIAAISGIICMKKIQPDDVIYPAWAVFAAMAFMAFVLWYSIAS